MTDKLKPCPFCGGEVGWKSGRIVCDKCDLNFKYHNSSFELTNKAWNTRKPMERIMEQLEYALNNGIPRINGKECNKREKTVYEMALEYAIEIVKTGGKGE